MARQHSFLSFDLMELRSGEAAGPPQSLVDKIKTTAGYKAVFFGRQHEDAKVGVLCIEWASSEAAQDYFRHHDGESELGRGDDAILKREIYETVSSSEEEKGRDEDEDLRAVLASAPCTEVFTGFGAEQGFVGNVLRFASEVGRERPKGYFGGVVLRSVKGQKGQEKGEGEEGDDVVRLLLGWQSVQAHGDAKGVEGGVIQRNIHELRSLRRSVSLFHVEFKEL